MKIGLFFGSFNPYHLGHKIVASYMAELTDLDQVWVIVSKQNPFQCSLRENFYHHKNKSQNIIDKINVDINFRI